MHRVQPIVVESLKLVRVLLCVVVWFTLHREGKRLVRSQHVKQSWWDYQMGWVYLLSFRAFSLVLATSFLPPL